LRRVDRQSRTGLIFKFAAALISTYMFRMGEDEHFKFGVYVDINEY